VTEKNNGFGHGLVMGYGQFQQTITNDDYEEDYTTGFDSYVDGYYRTIFTDYGGLDKTDILAGEGFEPAQFVFDNYANNPTKFTSTWFIPSAAQWAAALYSPGLGGVSRPSTGNGMMDLSGSPLGAINHCLSTRDGKPNMWGDYLSSSALQSDNHPVICASMNNSAMNFTQLWASSQTHSVLLRLFFAF
jgi:hypothetical protein